MGRRVLEEKLISLEFKPFYPFEPLAIVLEGGLIC
jgi:hypothetical protein